MSCGLQLLCWPTRDALHPTPLAEAPSRRHRARSAAAASDRRCRLVLVPWRAVRERIVTWGTSRSPTEHFSLRDAFLAQLSARPTRDALHPTPLAEAPLRKHRARSATAASNCRCRLVLVPWRAARARFATWRTSQPPTEHLSLHAACLARLSARPTRERAPPHAVGRGSSAPTPRRVGGCGFEPSLLTRSRPVARGARALRHVENQPTAHGAPALCALRAWRGCLRGQLAARSTPRRWPRLLCADTAPCRRLRLRTVVADSFSSRGARRARASSRGEPADRPQSPCSLRAACLARLSAWPTRGALHPTPLAEAPLRRHRAVLAAAASNRRC